MVDDKREALAAYAHDAWAGWVKWMFENGGGTMYIDPDHAVWAMYPDKFVRWRRQMFTPYADLPESEKESDRAEADKMLEIMRSGNG